MGVTGAISEEVVISGVGNIDLEETMVCTEEVEETCSCVIRFAHIEISSQENSIIWTFLKKNIDTVIKIRDSLNKLRLTASCWQIYCN